MPIPSPIFLINLKKKKLLEKKMDPKTDPLRVVKVPRSDSVWVGGAVVTSTLGGNVNL